MGGNESVAITAGLPGFLVLFFLALVCWFLFRDMSKRMRNVRKLAEEEDRKEAARTAEEDSGKRDDAEDGAVDDRPGERHTSPDERI